MVRTELSRPVGDQPSAEIDSAHQYMTMTPLGEPETFPAGSTGPCVRFGVFELDVRGRQLRKRGLRIRVPDQPLQILLLLIEQPGQVVTRDELRQKLWPADTFVEFDLSLNSAVRKLREALGDSADVPRFIETQPRRGYRFIAPVERSSVSMPAVAQVAQTPPSFSRQWRWVTALLVIVAVALGLSIIAPWRSKAATGVGTQIRSIAVLPLKNLTGDPSRESMVDSMTDAIISELARAGDVRVISRTSSMQYKGVHRRLPEIARELNVDAIVEGTATLVQGKMRLTAQLIHASTDKHLWTNGYQADDLMTMTDDMARGILAIIQQGTNTESALSRTASNSEAYDLYLRGLAARGRASHEGKLAALSYFQRAVASDRNFAEAHGGLALAQIQFLYSGTTTPDEVISEADAATRAALAIDDTVKDALRARVISRQVTGDYAGAESDVDRLVQYWPSAESYATRVEPLLRKKRFTEAVAAAAYAKTLDPLSVNTALLLARAFRAAGDHAKAIAELETAAELAPTRSEVFYQLGATLLLRGQTKAAIAALEKAVAGSFARNQRFVAYLGYAYAVDGRTDDSRRILQELLERRERGYVSSFGLAMLHDAVGDKAAAVAAFQTALRAHAVEFTLLDIYPVLRTLVSEPLYQDR
jgi:TolB-like protein/DNA-binding winged helix-turn-helix (wHTH) protein